MKKKSILSLRHRLICTMPLYLLIFLIRKNLLSEFIDASINTQSKESVEILIHYMEKRSARHPRLYLLNAFYFNHPACDKVNWTNIYIEYCNYLEERKHLLT